MSDQFKELLDIPRDFLHDGTQFMNRSVILMINSLDAQETDQFVDAQSVSCADPFTTTYVSNIH